MKKISLINSDNLTMVEAFEDFKGHCRIKNLSVETIKLYQYQFNVFHRFLDDETFLISDVKGMLHSNFARREQVCKTFYTLVSLLLPCPCT